MIKKSNNCKNKYPLVSIGLPVYNGENYIRESIEALINQSFSEFELIICDNASTDSTGAICKEYAAQDRRIHYRRNHQNLGAAPNFNLAYSLARGKYFKWAAHDDVCSNDFLYKCVAILERDHSAVLAFSKVMIIDKDSRILGPYDLSLPTDSLDRCERFLSLLGNHRSYMVFGLIRRDALDRTKQIMGEYNHGDGVLLERLALQGRFVEIPEYLFFSRSHSEQSMSLVMNREIYSIWFNTLLKNKVICPWSRVIFERIRTIHMYRMDLSERIKCYKYLYWNIKELLPVVIKEHRAAIKEIIPPIKK
jgi:glycosyltransferase involved in cell wall biosynthesis